MRGVRKGIYNGFSTRIIPFFVCLAIIISCPLSAYALNTDLVADEVYWIDKGNEINYDRDDYFAGFSKYIADENEGCFYLFTRFTDYRIDTGSKENITFAFTIENEMNSYYFQIDKDGIVNSSSQNAIDAVDVYYNFDEASCKRQGGGVYIAFKLRNAADRVLKNYICCEYSCGLNVTYNIFENICLDMYVPTTAKSTSQKAVKQTTSKNNSSKATNKATNATENKLNASNDAKESSTKFSGSGTVYSSQSSSNNTAKFSAAGQSSDTQVNNEVTGTKETDSDTIRENNDSALAMSNENVKPSLSQQAKMMIVIFAVLFVVGVVCVIIGLVNHKKGNADDAEEQ